MNEDALVETIGRWHDERCYVDDTDEEYAESLFAFLRAEGFEVYRPEECERVTLNSHGAIFHDFKCEVAFGDYRLVPVGEGTEQ